MNARHRLAVLVALVTLALPAAGRAGGFGVVLQGPQKDGCTYVADLYSCRGAASLDVQATAEGVVNGVRRQVPIALTRAKTAGEFTFVRAWPKDGRWAVRLAVRDRDITVLANVRPDGRLDDPQYFWGAEGARACNAALAALAR